MFNAGALAVRASLVTVSALAFATGISTDGAGSATATRGREKSTSASKLAHWLQCARSGGFSVSQTGQTRT
jgi:hypothetical protein